MTGDGGVADGLSQGECWDSNYKRQEESCWLAHKNLSKQSWEAQASPESRERSVTGDEDFYPQAGSHSPPTSPREHGLSLHFAPCLRLPLHQDNQGFICSKLGFAFSCSTLSKGHPNHHAACPSHFPTGLRQRRDFGSCFLYGTSCARKDGLAVTWEHHFPGLLREEKNGEQSSQLASVFHPLLPSCDFMPYCPSTPCPHFPTLP